MGKEEIGFCLCERAVIRRKDWLPLRIACQRGVVSRGLLLHGGSGAFALSAGVQALPQGDFLADTESWLFWDVKSSEARKARNRINHAAALRLQALTFFRT